MTVKKTASDGGEALHWREEDFTVLSEVNWPESYPDRPEVRFAAAHNGGELLLCFEVNEQCALGRVTQDNGPVWRDSCVEFFVAFDEGGYYNFEFNCLGSLLLWFGKGRGGRVEAPAGALQAVSRETSLGTEPFGLRCGGVRWSLEARIPTEALFMHRIESFDSLQTRANFYKCGDDLPQPHFLSWMPIVAPQPDFHLPEFFGKLSFE